MNTKLQSDKVYVAFLDILGFGEIVKNNSLDKVDGFFKTIELAFDDSTKVLNAQKDENAKWFKKIMDDSFIQLYTDVPVNALSISDSIYLWTENDSAFSFARVVHYVNRMLAYFMIMGIPARGAISMGSVSVREGRLGIGSPNVYGTGLVRAHELEGKQKWAGAVIDKEVIDYVEMFTQWGELLINQLLIDQWIMPYNVPMKQEVGHLYTINWTINFSKSEYGRNANKLKLIFAANNKSIDTNSVKEKIINTTKYFIDMKNIKKKRATS